MNIFDTADFMPRKMCGAWTPLLINFHVIANVQFIIAYFVVSYVFLDIWRKRKDIMYSWMVLLFSAFIFLCGLSHLSEVLVFWWPAYRFFVLLYMVGGVVSLVTAIFFPLVMHRKMKLLSREDYQRMIAQLKIQVNARDILLIEKEKVINMLDDHIQNLEVRGKRGLLIHEQQQFLIELKNLVHSISEKHE